MVRKWEKSTRALLNCNLGLGVITRKKLSDGQREDQESRKNSSNLEGGKGIMKYILQTRDFP